MRARNTITADELAISAGALHDMAHQEQIPRDERSTIIAQESAEPTKAKKRLQQLDAAVAILERAAKLLGKDRSDPKRFIK